MLYAGEQFDTDTQQYYLRARYYDQNTGRFNRMDPFTGNNQDPQSLHKYLYCHANPINATDPTGKLGDFSLVGMMMAFGIAAILWNPNVANAPGPNDYTISDQGGQMYLDMWVCLVAVPVLRLASRYLFVPLVHKLRTTFGRVFQRITRKLPSRLARAVTGKVDDVVRLGHEKATDVFVTTADEIAGITDGRSLAEKLTLVDKSGNLLKGPFKVIEFDNPVKNLASPVFRTNPGFVGGGRTAGGAVEYILPNMKVSELSNVTTRVIRRSSGM
jgi:RHS repeat-associated protein